MMLLYGTSLPEDAWIDNGDGTATHIVTGLMWMRSALGQAWTGSNSIGEPKKLGLEAAEKIVHHFAGHDDWRVPSTNELMSIVELEGDGPCIDMRIFPNHGHHRYFSLSGHAIDFSSGSVSGNCYARFGSYALRLVRKAHTTVGWETNTNLCDNGDGTATDTTTGLTWMRFALGQTWNVSRGVGEAYSLTYDDAMSIRHTFAGFDDWRLPTIGELNSIVDRNRKNPSADSSIFTNMVGGSYLTSTLKTPDRRPYFVDFSNGSIESSYTDEAGVVLLVRGEHRHSLSAIGAEQGTADYKDTSSHELSLSKTGSGSGEVSGGRDGETFVNGRIVTLTARAAAGSVFDEWTGDATGHDTTLSFTFDSPKKITAKFSKLDFRELGIKVEFDGTQSAEMRSGDEAFIFTFSITNTGAKQVHLECPMATYITVLGEEIEQDAWLSGLFNGAKGANIRSGSFRKTGLVFNRSKLKKIFAGDHLHITTIQTKPERRFIFVFRCTDTKNRSFTLIDAAAENAPVTETNVADSPDVVAGLVQRIESLEASLSVVLQKLDALQTVASAPAGISARENDGPQTFDEVLAWLSTRERVSLGLLRKHLRPLDLLPSALIDEFNEQALGLVGEPALEEIGDEIVVIQSVLAEVLLHRNKTPQSTGKKK